MSGARIFVHPACVPEGPRSDALLATFAAHGHDVERLRVFQRDELMKLVSENDDGSITLERFDGHRFVHGMPKVLA